MVHVSSRVRNPFGLDPPCEAFVPGYGNASADFHVVGDHPGRHGGVSSGIPFTGTAGGRALLEVLEEVGLIDALDPEPVCSNCFLSYLHLCVADGDPGPAAYRELERFFDAELRAVTAHVLLPVGERPIRHVLAEYSTVSDGSLEPEALHAGEISTGSWLVVPVAEPLDWSDGQRDALVATLRAILGRDYRRESDLGRFFPGGDPYLVR
ncbi:MAG: uracil-DNA glycosylase family protein [Halodesulfurarchaeum sp.]